MATHTRMPRKVFAWSERISPNVNVPWLVCLVCLPSLLPICTSFVHLPFTVSVCRMSNALLVTSQN